MTLETHVKPDFAGTTRRRRTSTLPSRGRQGGPLRTLSALLALFGVAALPLAAGCSQEADTELATLQIPLVQIAPDGSLYRLRDAQFQVTLPDGSSFIADGNIDQPTLTLTLNPGVTFVLLLDGWTLERSLDGGATYEAQPALLASANPAGIRVVPNRTLSISFQFFVRRVTGDVVISFGVDPQPRQLSGGIRWLSGTGAYAVYAGQNVDIQIYFEPASQTLVTEPDGSLARVTDSIFNALEFFNDPYGLLGPLAEQFAGGYLIYTLRIRPDGVHQFEASYFGGGAPVQLNFGPSTFALLTAGADGFPADAFFYATGSDIELTDETGMVVLTGRLQSIRHFMD